GVWKILPDREADGSEDSSCYCSDDVTRIVAVAGVRSVSTTCVASRESRSSSSWSAISWLGSVDSGSFSSAAMRYPPGGRPEMVNVPSADCRPAQYRDPSYQRSRSSEKTNTYAPGGAPRTVPVTVVTWSVITTSTSLSDCDGAP